MCLITRLTILGVLLSLPACSDQGESDKGTSSPTDSSDAASKTTGDAPRAEELFKAPEGPLPEFVKDSRYLKELGKKEYPAAQGPADAVSIRFDFSKEGVLTYDYGQGVVMSSQMGSVKKGMGQKMKGKGLLELKSKGDKSATLVMRDFRMNVEMDLGGEAKSMESSMPPVVAQGVQEDGTMKVGNSSAEALLSLLFPIPSKALKVGESDKVPGTFPVNVMGSPLHAKGFSTITLTKFVTVDGKTCARVDTEIDISDLEVPEELPWKAVAGVFGKSVFYYDVTSRAFVSGELALTMSVRMEGSMPMPSFPDAKAPPPSQMKTRMVMDSDNHITLGLKPEDTEEK